MKITAIELCTLEIDEVVNYLTSKFNTEDSRQTIEFQLTEINDYINDDLFSVESVLELYTEYPEVDENNQTAISYRSVVKYSTTFFYDGEEIKVDSKNLYAIDELIHKYYEI